MGNFIDIKNMEKYNFIRDGEFIGQYHNEKQLLLSSKCQNSYIIIKKPKDYSIRMYYQECYNPMKEIQIYQWRNLTKKPIAKVICVQMLPQHTKGFIYTQHFVKTLKQCHDLNINETIYVLKSLISGYGSIYKVLGFVNVNLQYCGINTKGQVKVWINSNLANNEAIGKKIKDEATIVYDIIYISRGLVSEQQQYFFIEMLKDIQLKAEAQNNITFTFIEKYIDSFCLKNKITISKKIEFNSQPETTVSLKVTQNKKINKNINYINTQKVLLSSRQFKKINQYYPHNTSKYARTQNYFRSKKKEIENCLKLEKTNHQINSFRGELVVQQQSISKNMNKRNVPQFLFKKQGKKYQNQSSRQIQHLSKREINTTSSKYVLKQNNQNQIKSRTKISPYTTLKRLTQLSSEANSQKFILTSIKEGNQEFQLKNTKLVVVQIQQQPKEKLKKKISFCHQFTINIMNYQNKNHGNPVQKNCRRSSISTNKTRYNSKNSKNSNILKNSHEVIFNSKVKSKHSYNTEQRQRNTQQLWISLNKYENEKNKENKDNFDNTIKQKQNSHQKNYYSNNLGQISINNIQSVNQSEHFTKKDKQQLPKRNRKFVDDEQQSLIKEIKQKQQKIYNANSWKKTLANLLSSGQFQYTLNKSVVTVNQQSTVQENDHTILKAFGRQITSVLAPPNE